MPLEPRPLEPPPFRSTPTSDTQRRSTKAFKFPRRDNLSASDAPVHVPQNAFGLKDPRSSVRFCAENLAAVFAAESINNVRDLEQELKVSAEAEMQRRGADDVKDRVSNLTKTITAEDSVPGIFEDEAIWQLGDEVEARVFHNKRVTGRFGRLNMTVMI